MRPASARPVPDAYRERILAGRPRLYAIAEEHYGLQLNPGPFGIDSRPALVGAKYAEAQGAGDAYHQGVFEAYWQHGRDISDRDVLAGIAAGAGLEPEAFRAALDEALWQSAVDADIEQAFAYGLSGVPALLFARRFLVSGAQPYDALARIADHVAGEVGSADAPSPPEVSA